MYQPNQLPQLTSDPEIALATGHLRPMTSSYASRWDGMDGDVVQDFGWIGVDPDSGVWMTVHPETALAQHPEIWDAVHEWWGGCRDLTSEDYHSKSAFEHSAKIALMGSAQRALQRPDDGE